MEKIDAIKDDTKKVVPVLCRGQCVVVHIIYNDFRRARILVR